MKKYLKNKIFEIISNCSAELNLDSYVIGGFVRDSIIGVKKPKDIDIVCVGSGINLAKIVSKKLKLNKVQIFKNFGTAMIKHNNLEIEFVGARKESYSKDSRNPTVKKTSLEEDQKRRDFTINTIAISLNKNSYGEIIDPFQGVNDIKRKIIKTPLDPQLTYFDDPLRMMRAIRFSSQLNFDIEKKSLDSIIQNSKRIKIISQERITEELNKIIKSDKPSIGFNLLFKTNLLKYFFSELSDLQGVEIIHGMRHKDNFFHTLKVLDNLSLTSDNFWLRWAALLHDIGKPATKKFDENNGWTFHGHEYVGSKMVPKVFKKLKLPLNEKMRYVQKLVLLHLRPIGLSKEIVTDSAIRRLLFECGNDIEDLLLLCEADITSKNKHKVLKYLNNFKIVRKKIEDIEKRDKIRNWQPPITGQKIMKTFNIKPSKEVGDIKNKIRESILDGDIKNNYEDAYKLMLKIGNDMGLIKV